MDNYPRQKLSEIISQYGREVLDDPRRLEGLLHDYCGAFKKEVNVLVAALKEHVPFEILKMKDSLPQEVQLARLISRLVDDLALSEDAAGWAVQTWALALKVIDKPGLIVKRPKPLILDSQLDLILTLASDVTLELVHVPAGEFLMGSVKGKDLYAQDDEKPQHKVYLEEYLIGKYPMTVAQFAAFVKASGYQTSAEMEGSGHVQTGGGWVNVKGGNWQHPLGLSSDVSMKADHPVTLVSWKDAMAFCRWACQTTRCKVRLPSEAEWEKAARGTDGRKYPWGDQKPDNSYCNFNMDIGDTTPVGKYSPKGDSPYGCADMVGNVWEWTSSLYKSYPYKADDGRENLKDRGRRALRGGSFYDRFGGYCAFRYRNSLLDWREYFSFRVEVSP